MPASYVNALKALKPFPIHADDLLFKILKINWYVLMHENLKCITRMSIF